MADEMTTTLIVNKDQLDTLIIALSDCQDKCKQRLEWAEAAYNELSLERNPSPKLKAQADEIKALAEFTLSQIPGIVIEINEVYPELEEREESKNKIITKPTWNP